MVLVHPGSPGHSPGNCKTVAVVVVTKAVPNETVLFKIMYIKFSY